MSTGGQREDVTAGRVGVVDLQDRAGGSRSLGAEAPEGFAIYDIRGMPLLGMAVVVGDPYRPDLVRVALSGELCASSASRLESLVDDLIGAGVTVRLNLYDLDSCTSHGVAALERIRDRLEALGGCLELVGAHDVVRRVLDIAGFAATGRRA